MTQKIRHCSICSGAMELKAIPALSVEEAPLRLSVEGMPAYECAKGHRMPVHRDFLVWLIREVRGLQSRVLAGKESGMIFKKYSCGACATELGAKVERRDAIAADVAYPDAPGFRLAVELPFYKCPACGKEQLRSEKMLQGGAVPNAVASLNDAAKFPHSG